MKKRALTKEEWVAEAYRVLCEHAGAPKTKRHIHNLFEWAKALADQDGSSYFDDGYSPREAAEEDISCC